jgi:hypothetical protein
VQWSDGRVDDATLIGWDGRNAGEERLAGVRFAKSDQKS